MSIDILIYISEFKTDLIELRSVATTLTRLGVPQPKDSHPLGVVEA